MSDYLRLADEAEQRGHLFDLDESAEKLLRGFQRQKGKG